jgi:preprotein translocase subunit SecF
MTISNKQKTIRLRRLFFLVSLVIALAALAFFLLDYFIYGIAAVGVFALWFLYFQVADYQFVEFSDSNGKILLRYYKAVRFGKTNFNSIEFPQQMLYSAHFENSLFGKMSDLTLVVKTRRGIAEYPSVSLAALSFQERRQLQERLLQILGV